MSLAQVIRKLVSLVVPPRVVPVEPPQPPKRGRGRPPGKGKGAKRRRKAPAKRRARRASSGKAGTALVPVDPPARRALVVFKAKPITAEQFFDRAQEAKRNAMDALGERWDLVEGESSYLFVPSRYRTFRTVRGTRIRTSGDRRYPVARWWPGEVLPPLVVAVPDGPREASWDAIRARVSRLPRLTYDGPGLELVPELAAE